MRNLFILAFVLLLGSAIIVGCGEKTDSDAGKVPAEVKKAESMDSTRLDSADHSMMNHDSMSHENMSHDSM